MSVKSNPVAPQAGVPMTLLLSQEPSTFQCVDQVAGLSLEDRSSQSQAKTLSKSLAASHHSQPASRKLLVGDSETDLERRNNNDAKVDFNNGAHYVSSHGDGTGRDAIDEENVDSDSESDAHDTGDFGVLKREDAELDEDENEESEMEDEESETEEENADSDDEEDDTEVEDDIMNHTDEEGGTASAPLRFMIPEDAYAQNMSDLDNIDKQVGDSGEEDSNISDALSVPDAKLSLGTPSPTVESRVWTESENLGACGGEEEVSLDICVETPDGGFFAETDHEGTSDFVTSQNEWIRRPDFEVFYASEKQLQAAAERLCRKTCLAGGIILKRHKDRLKIAHGRYSFGSHYVKVRKLGEGAQGACYEMMDKVTEFHFCVKKIKGEYRPEEVTFMIYLLDIEGFPQIFGAIKEENCVYLLMELLKGCSLTKWIELFSLQDSAGLVERLRWFYQLLERVRIMTTHGILHEDIKADNIMMTTNRQGQIVPVVIDFGLSTCPPVPAEKPSFGTVTHFSPEKAKSEGHGCKADVYASTTCFVHSLLSEVPIQDSNHFRVLLKIGIRGPPFESLPQWLPPCLTRLIHHGWDANPETRSSAEEMQWEIEEILRDKDKMDELDGVEFDSDDSEEDEDTDDEAESGDEDEDDCSDEEEEIFSNNSLSASVLGVEMRDDASVESVFCETESEHERNLSVS